MTLRRVDHATLDRLRRAGDLVQHAVDAEPDAQVVRGRLDVDVGGPLLQGLAQDQVDVLDDRGVLDDGVKVGELGDPRLVAGGGLRGRGLGGEGRLPVVAVDPRQVLGDLARAADDDRACRVPSNVRRSSMAKTSDGFAMPMTGVSPRYPIASTRWRRASDSGMSLVASGSSGYSLRSTNSMPASAAEARMRSSSETRPSSLRISPSDLPVAACSRSAASISSLRDLSRGDEQLGEPGRGPCSVSSSDDLALSDVASAPAVGELRAARTAGLQGDGCLGVFVHVLVHLGAGSAAYPSARPRQRSPQVGLCRGRRHSGTAASRLQLVAVTSASVADRGVSAARGCILRRAPALAVPLARRLASPRSSACGSLRRLGLAERPSGQPSAPPQRRATTRQRGDSARAYIRSM